MRRHLTYANVVATIALVIAVAGIPTAVAVTKKAAKNTVNSKAIVDGSVTAKDLAGVRVETVLASGDAQELKCRRGEQFLSGGIDSPSGVSGFGPTVDGNGFYRAGGNALGLSILCLKSTQGK